MANKVAIKANQILMREGEHSNSMYWVQQGQLIVTKKRLNEEVILGHIFEGELVGEISFLDKETRSATVKALTDCELIEIPQETIDNIFKIFDLLMLSILSNIILIDANKFPHDFPILIPN
jgi:CRP-like cAMP-binding protein